MTEQQRIANLERMARQFGTAIAYKSMHHQMDMSKTFFPTPAIDHGRMVSVDKYHLSPDFLSYIIDYEDGYTEGRIKVYDPLRLAKLTSLLNERHISFTMERLAVPPEPKGTQGWTVRFEWLFNKAHQRI